MSASREYPATRSELKTDIDEFENLYGRKPVILAPDILLIAMDEWNTQRNRVTLPSGSNPVEARRARYAKLTVMGCKLYVGAESYGLE